MGVSNIGGSSMGGSSAATQTDLAARQNGNPNAVQDFMSYMKETPAQQMEDAWLSAHGISKAAFNAMSPAQKKALLDEMKQDIERKLKEQVQNMSTKTSSNVAAS